MALYYGSDIKTDLSGDLTVSANGDFEIASTTMTHIDNAAFVLRTISKDFAASNYSVGADLHQYIGQLSSEELYQDIENRIVSTLTQTLFKKNDLTVSVVPIDESEILVYINVIGLFVSNNAEYENSQLEMIFSFPMYEGDGIRLLSFQTRE